MRLINADKCLEDLKTAFKDQSTPEDPNTPNTWTAAMIAVIKNQPTVLDPERVIAEIHKQRDEYGRNMREENTEFVKGGEALFQAKASHAWYSGVRAGLLRALDIIQDAVLEKTDMLRYEVYEDNSGGLSMFVLHNGRPIWGYSGYEHVPESLQKDIRTLQTTNSIEGWDGNGSYDGHNFYTWEELGTTLEEYYRWHHVFDSRTVWVKLRLNGKVGAQLVADSDGIYPERMGCIAQKAFHVGEYAEDAEDTETHTAGMPRGM